MINITAQELLLLALREDNSIISGICINSFDVKSKSCALANGHVAKWLVENQLLPAMV